MPSSLRTFGLIPLLLCGLSIHLCAGQSTPTPDTVAQRPYLHQLSLGLDVFKSVPSVVLGKYYFITNAAIIEPVLRHRTRRGHYNQLLLGYVRGTSIEPSETIARQQVQGWYLKAGPDWDITRRRGYGYFGLSAVVAGASYRGTFRIPGRTFGDYEGPFRERGNLAWGGEFTLARNFYLSDRWMLRWLFRGTVLRRTQGELRPHYYPGAGYTLGMYRRLFSYGSTLQLHYRLR
ncbi:hypothetical protein GCM10027275_29810 [Rhabdobacter roseus]|uniref:DUF3575 domain-containing protein n=1 Tax=Rhabdobacter roseus TaxID=1655419 RepID=A0A840TL65_9BACT|nr:hypothetical protein [Rhabdobacter roseus]MBB5284936.1 hypothetical protein [Rhabdobacter roseus]